VTADGEVALANERYGDIAPIDRLFRLRCRLLQQEHIVALGIV
jgi:hypothetical protein